MKKMPLEEKKSVDLTNGTESDCDTPDENRKEEADRKGEIDYNKEINQKENVIKTENVNKTEETEEAIIQKEKANIDEETKKEEAKKEEAINYKKAASTNEGTDKIEKANADQETNLKESINKKNDITKGRKAKKQTGNNKKKKLVAISVLCTVCLIVILVYGATAVYFQSHFLPHTMVNGLDCSHLTVAEAALLLESRSQEYELKVTGRTDRSGNKDILGGIRSQDIGLHLKDAALAAEFVLKQQKPMLWPKAFMSTLPEYEVETEVVFDEDLLKEHIRQWEAFQRKKMIKPENAYIDEFSEKRKSFEIVAETPGTMLDMDKAEEMIANAVLNQETEIDLEEQDCYITAKVTAKDKKLNEYLALANLWLETNIVYDWNGTEVLVDRERVQEWISFDKNKPVLDEEAVAEFVSGTARELDTYGKKRSFTTALGIELTLPGGAYGWKTDREGETEELLQLIYQGRTMNKEPLYISKGASKGKDDIGSSYVEADLSNQHLYLYQNGELVLETDFVSGNMSKSGCMTPPGVFGLTYKTTKAVLRGEDYETPVNYWMPFNGNVGMHDATWRARFGGDIYLTGGSHGCINLPLKMAAQIYQYVSTGFPVICYYY